MLTLLRDVRYDIDPGPPAHVSDTCVVLFATDHGDEKIARGRFKGKRVALKLLHSREQFENELAQRKLLNPDGPGSGTSRVVRFIADYGGGLTDGLSVGKALNESFTRKLEEMRADEVAELHGIYEPGLEEVHLVGDGIPQPEGASSGKPHVGQRPPPLHGLLSRTLLMVHKLSLQRHLRRTSKGRRAEKSSWLMPRQVPASNSTSRRECTQQCALRCLP